MAIFFWGWELGVILSALVYGAIVGILEVHPTKMTMKTLVKFSTIKNTQILLSIHSTFSRVTMEGSMFLQLIR